MTRRQRARVKETLGEFQRRIIDQLEAESEAWGLPAAEAIYIFEGAADRVRRKAEECKRATRGGGR